jgi:hypothetical protein
VIERDSGWVVHGMIKQRKRGNLEEGNGSVDIKKLEKLTWKHKERQLHPVYMSIKQPLNHVVSIGKYCY